MSDNTEEDDDLVRKQKSKTLSDSKSAAQDSATEPRNSPGSKKIELNSESRRQITDNTAGVQYQTSRRQSRRMSMMPPIPSNMQLRARVIGRRNTVQPRATDSFLLNKQVPTGETNRRRSSLIPMELVEIEKHPGRVIKFTSQSKADAIREKEEKSRLGQSGKSDFTSNEEGKSSEKISFSSVESTREKQISSASDSRDKSSTSSYSDSNSMESLKSPIRPEHNFTSNSRNKSRYNSNSNSGESSKSRSRSSPKLPTTSEVDKHVEDENKKSSAKSRSLIVHIPVISNVVEKAEDKLSDLGKPKETHENASTYESMPTQNAPEVTNKIIRNSLPDNKGKLVKHKPSVSKRREFVKDYSTKESEPNSKLTFRSKAVSFASLKSKAVDMKSKTHTESSNTDSRTSRRHHKNNEDAPQKSSKKEINVGHSKAANDINTSQNEKGKSESSHSQNSQTGKNSDGHYNKKRKKSKAKS